MQFAPTQIASSPRVAGRSTRRRSENASRQLALFGEGTRTLPLTSSANRLVLDTTPVAAPAAAAAATVAQTVPAPRAAAPVPLVPQPKLRVLPVVRPSAVAVVAPLPAEPQRGTAAERVLTAEDELWQPLTGVQKLLEIGGASLLMVACVALAIFW